VSVPAPPFDAWALPSWMDAPERTRTTASGEVRYPVTDGEWIGGLSAELAKRGVGGSAGSGEGPASGGEPMRDRAERIRALGEVGARFLDPADELRHEALALIPATSGLSAPMAQAVLDGMARDWLPDRLERLLLEELGDPSPLDRLVERSGRKSMAVPPRLVVQMVAGSVPGVGATALVRSLLLGAPTLLKPGLGDVVVPVLFARALRGAFPDLADLLAVVYWPGGEEEVERAALRPAEVVVAYGGDATVASVRARAPATARFIGYHHRAGMGVVGAGALTSESVARETARSVARAVALFDQRGCVSTRVAYVEDAGASVTPSGFATLLADALDELEAALPAGALDHLERSAVHQLRGTAEMLASGWGDDAEDRPMLRHGGAAPWSVFYDPYRAVETSCVGRVVVVRPFRSLDELVERVRPVGPHLQTVGVAGLGDRLTKVAEALGRLGVSRVAPFAAVPFPKPWWHHDGRGPLADLVRWVDLERGEGGIDG
jgi:hypothetical protein